jgi:signal transduction histidine kinase
MLTAIIVVTSLAQILISLFVLFRARSNRSNQLFFFIGIASLGWALTNYLSAVLLDSPDLIYIARLVMLFVVLQNTAFCLFAHTFPNADWNLSRRWLVGYGVLSFLAAVAAISPFLFTSLEVKDDLAYLSAGPAMPIFIAHAAFSIFTGFRQLVRKKRASSGRLKRQLRILLFASFLIWIVVPATNFALTPLLKTTFFIVYAPLYTFAFASIIAYAMVSQRLFDIRAAVARSVTYVLVLGTLGLIYGAVIFGLPNLFVSESFRDSTAYQALNIILVVLLAFSFPPIKRFFDRITNQVFYRDAYDTQAVLDELGGLIVAEIDLHRVLSGTRTILSEAVKSSFIEFILFEQGKPRPQSVGKHVLQTNLEELSSHIRQQKKEIVITEELGSTSQLKEWFSKDSVAVSLRLKTQRQLVGYVLFGDKRSGDIYSSQDIAMLTIVASELAIVIQNALRFEEIQQFNVTLQKKIEEATRELRRANSRLREIDRAKDEFISMASHQLRTPLTAVKGYLSMVLEGDTGPVKKDQREMIQRGFDGAQKMVYLIADMLNVSRLQTGKFVIENKPTKLADIVQSEVQQLQEQAQNRGVELTYQKPEDFPTLSLDENKIRQVVMNFIDNAIYYTPREGKIDVKLEATPEAVSYTVTDTGVGVPKSVQHHLFSKFYRADNAKKLRPDGTGLGLYMAKKVVIAQGGAIIFRSTEGKGSTFGFRFPLKNIGVPEKTLAKK